MMLSKIKATRRQNALEPASSDHADKSVLRSFSRVNKSLGVNVLSLNGDSNVVQKTRVSPRQPSKSVVHPEIKCHESDDYIRTYKHAMRPSKHALSTSTGTRRGIEIQNASPT